MPITLIKINHLFFQPWADIRQVSQFLVPIRKTPHYKFSYASIAAIKKQGQAPHSGTGYGRYTLFEAHCMQTTEPMHSKKAYFANINNWWKLGCNTKMHPVLVASFSAPEKNKRITRYGIIDGAHRAAFIAAAVDHGLAVAGLYCDVRGDATAKVAGYSRLQLNSDSSYSVAVTKSFR